MGISFKVSKTGKRFNPKPPPPAAASFPAGDEESNDVVVAVSNNTSDSIPFSTRKLVGEASDTNGIPEISDTEVSFCLNLFNDGYSISKPMETESERQTSGAVPKTLHPYDRASETLFSAIESGRLPGDILDDIPCKYVNGTVVCEVRDYRKCSSEGLSVTSGGSAPVINRVRLRMSLENIVKDIPTISENDWTYGDLMEVESRILKALQPKLTLDPNPQLDRLYQNPVNTKLNLELRTMRRKRLRQIPEVAVTSNNLYGKKVCLNRVPESSRLGDSVSLGQQSSFENLTTQNTSSMLPLRNNNFGSEGSLLKYHIGVVSPRRMKDPRLLSPDVQDGMIPIPDNNASVSIDGKRENQDGQSSPLMNKRTRLEGNMHHLGPQIDNLHGSELQWKNTVMQQHQSIGRGIQYATNNGMQNFSPQVFDGRITEEGVSMPFTIRQQGIRYNVKEEPVENERLDKPGHRMTGSQQRLPSQFMRSGFPQSPWNNIAQTLDSSNNPRKEDPFQKRKLVQSPHVSVGGGLPQSPLSSKSGEFSSGSHQFGAVVSSGLITQKEKSVGANDSMQRQNQAKRRSNSLPKTPSMSGVGSPVSVSNMSVPVSASSPAVGSQPLGDQTMLNRFSKIERVTMRCQLNNKKNKINEYPIRKPNSYPTQHLTTCLSNDSNNGILKDETYSLSKSLIGGNINISKIRTLNFTQTEHIIQGNSFQLVTKARTRMIMSEKPHNGAVAIHIGEIEDAEYFAAEDFLPTLPNTHIADLLATQYSSLMAREGYDVEDNLQPKAVQLNNPVGQQGIPPTPNMQQPFSEGVSIQPSNGVGNNNAPPLNSPHNVHGQPRMPPPGNNNQPIQMSQGLGVSMPSHRPQQSEHQQLPSQQPQQFQRPLSMLTSNMHQLGPYMGNKQSALQLQLLQQQQRKMMSAGMGSVGNNAVGLGGGLGNVMGLSSGSRGMGMNIASAIRNGTITQEQATLLKMRIQQQHQQQIRSSMSNMLGVPQPGGIGGGLMSGAGGSTRQMHPMLGQASMSRASINSQMMQQQRMAMGQMGPPKLIPAGMNIYMNQQQQMQLQQQQQMQQQQQQMQQQESVVVSPPQVGSPSSMGMSQQLQQHQGSPQQRTPMSPQLSSGGMHGMSGGNTEACPASPQLSSQTMGSVGSMANSPMEMPGVNNNNNNNNNNGQ